MKENASAADTSSLVAAETILKCSRELPDTLQSYFLKYVSKCFCNGNQVVKNTDISAAHCKVYIYAHFVVFFILYVCFMGTARSVKWLIEP